MTDGLPIPGVRAVVTTGLPARDERGRLVIYLHPEVVRELQRRRRERYRHRVTEGFGGALNEPLPPVGPAL